jgi:hypothetical protein
VLPNFGKHALKRNKRLILLAFIEDDSLMARKRHLKKCGKGRRLLWPEQAAQTEPGLSRLR